MFLKGGGKLNCKFVLSTTFVCLDNTEKNIDKLLKVFADIKVSYAMVK